MCRIKGLGDESQPLPCPFQTNAATIDRMTRRNLFLFKAVFVAIVIAICYSHELACGMVLLYLGFCVPGALFHVYSSEFEGEKHRVGLWGFLLPFYALRYAWSGFDKSKKLTDGANL